MAKDVRDELDRLISRTREELRRLERARAALGSRARRAARPAGGATKDS